MEVAHDGTVVVDRGLDGVAVAAVEIDHRVGSYVGVQRADRGGVVALGQVFVEKAVHDAAEGRHISNRYVRISGVVIIAQPAGAVGVSAAPEIHVHGRELLAGFAVLYQQRLKSSGRAVCPAGIV